MLAEKINEITVCKEATKEPIKDSKPKTILENKACQLVRHLKKGSSWK